MYSTVPPWLQCWALPLIDALTGAPGRLFPTCSSEVVWYIGRGAEPSQQTGSSLGFFPGTGSSSQLFHIERIYHIFPGKSIPTPGKNAPGKAVFLHCNCGGKTREKGLHNHKNSCVLSGDITRRVMLTNVTISTIYRRKSDSNDHILSYGLHKHKMKKWSKSCRNLVF